MNRLEERLEKFGAEKIFIGVFLFFGLMILFMRPPYQLMDEINHFPRAWQISEGIFLSPTMKLGEYNDTANPQAKKIFNISALTPADALDDKVYVAEVPVSFLPDDFVVNPNDRHYIHDFSLEYVEKFLATPLNVDDCETVQIPNTGVYPPPTYLPQAFAAFIGRALNLNAGIIFYLMGLSGLIFVTACVWLSMKFLPEAKQLIFLIAMMPMFLIEAASTSADAVTFGVCLIGTAWLLSLRNSEEKAPPPESLKLIILSIMLACSKSVYGTILLLYFLIPRERFGSLKKFLAVGTAALLVNLFVSLAWNYLAVTLSGVDLYTNYWLGFTETNAAAQKIFVTEHPAEFLAALMNSFGKFAVWYMTSFIGSWGFLWNVTLSLGFHIVYFTTLIYFTINSGLRLKLGERALLIFAAGISTFAFFLVHYLKWTPVGADYVVGVQGRYFIPIALMIFVALSIFRPLLHKNSIALAAGVFSGVTMLLTNFLAFY